MVSVDEFTPLMIVRAKALHSKLPDLCRLINEVVQKQIIAMINV